jgi:D-cysteine desulfhydrase
MSYNGVDMSESFPLLDAFPLLDHGLPRVQIASLPTPVERLDALERDGSGARLYIKRDDLSADAFGGNKIRKLELILGWLVGKRAKRVLTFGFAGSNHAAATALFAGGMGIKCVSMLMPQPNSPVVRQNLLLGHRCGAELHEFPTLRRLIWGAVWYRATRRERCFGIVPMIPAGGTMPLGNAGYVNAAFELKAQVERGELRDPSAIFVPAGSLGTAAGLAVGLAAAGLKSRVVAVRATERRFACDNALRKQVLVTARFLRRRDRRFLRVTRDSTDIFMEHRYFGDGYGCLTPAGRDAMRRLEERHGICLDGVYAAKAFAAFLDAARDPDNKNKTLLFWNTGNSRRMDDAIADIDYRELPRVFHRYFEET